jgi:hypothetical protein
MDVGFMVSEKRRLQREERLFVAVEPQDRKAGSGHGPRNGKVVQRR